MIAKAGTEESILLYSRTHAAPTAEGYQSFFKLERIIT
jgi:hypothetical protein